jgi:hypothetical protein
MNGNKLAQKLRTEDTLLIEKTENYYWISNTYFAVRLNNYDFNNFISKYNSYKSTESFRELPETGQVLDYKLNDYEIKEKTPVSNVINFLSNLKETIITNINIQSGSQLMRVYQVNNEIGYLDNNYNWLLEETDNKQVFAEGLLKPVVFKNKNEEINLLIMPLRGQGGNSLEEELSKLNINYTKNNNNKTLNRYYKNLKSNKWIKQNEFIHKTNLEKDKKLEKPLQSVKKYEFDDKPETQTKEEKDNKENKKTAVVVEDSEEKGRFAILNEDELSKAKILKKEKLGINLGLDFKTKRYYICKIA